MAETFPFEVHAPSRLFFREPVESVIISIADGEIAILKGHSAFTAPVKTGFLKIKNNKGEWKTAFTADGIIELKEHKTVLMTEAAEWGSEIDRERALHAREKAEKMLKEGMMRFEKDNAVLSLTRAEYRLKVWEIENRETPRT